MSFLRTTRRFFGICIPFLDMKRSGSAKVTTSKSAFSNDICKGSSKVNLSDILVGENSFTVQLMPTFFGSWTAEGSTLTVRTGSQTSGSGLYSSFVKSILSEIFLRGLLNRTSTSPFGLTLFT